MRKNHFRLHAFFLLFLLSMHAWSAPIQIKTTSQEGFFGKFNLANPTKPGVIIEILRAIERVDPDIRFVGLENKMMTARIEIEVEKGTLDAFFGIIKTPERSAKFNLIDPPLYLIHQMFVVRSDDNVEIKTLDDIRKLGEAGTILVVPGTAQAQYLKQQGGLILDEGSKGAGDNLKKLILKRGRFYYGSSINTAEEITTQGLTGQVKFLPVKFQPEAIHAIFSKQVPAATVDRVKAALNKLQASGELGKIFSKYAPN